MEEERKYISISVVVSLVILTVLGVIAVGGGLFGERVMYPDVPLRKVNYSENDTSVAFIINHDFSEKLDIDAEYIFIGNCDNSEKAKHLYPRSKIFSIGNEIEGLYYIPNPSMVEIDGLVFLVLFDNNPLKALKRRYVSIKNNDFLIDTLPDIILTNQDVNTNYKAITIINNKSKIELKSRNVKEI